MWLRLTEFLQSQSLKSEEHWAFCLSSKLLIFLPMNGRIRISKVIGLADFLIYILKKKVEKDYTISIY
jgi:hypothetical protein